MLTAGLKSNSVIDEAFLLFFIDPASIYPFYCMQSQLCVSVGKMVYDAFFKNLISIYL